MLIKRIFVLLRSLLAVRFNLDDDKEHENEVAKAIKKNIEFKGPNLWTLIFAIFIASIGLNVNSTAVVIGAMLISPLMGPIMGIGLGIGTNDLDLVRFGIKNILIAAFFSIITSALYFWITPLHEAQSEILARTTPSIWDVFIALFGGFAGIIAATRKEKTNVIAGVAIATALMPPLCTAGFGLANGQMMFFFGALYLFFINCVFICISTYLIVRYLKFPKKEFEDKKLEKRVSRSILWIVTLTTLPSIYLAYNIVDRSIFETNARKFITDEFRFKKTQVVNQKFSWKNRRETIDLLLIGEELSGSTIDTIKSHLKKYKLSGANLVIRQGLNAKQEIDFSEIKASILQDVFSQNDSLEKEHYNAEKEGEFPDLKKELLALYPDVSSYSLSNSVVKQLDTSATDTLVIALFHFERRKTNSERQKLNQWLKSRLKADSVHLVVE